MRKELRIAAVATLVLTAAVACTRRVQVESEPNEPQYHESSAAGAESHDLQATPRQ